MKFTNYPLPLLGSTRRRSAKDLMEFASLFVNMKKGMIYNSHNSA